MFKQLMFLLVVLIVLGGRAISAQEVVAQAPQPAVAGEHQAWLKQFEGEWTTSMKAAGPAAGAAGNDEASEAALPQGTMSSKMLGDFWIVSHYDADMGGARMHAIHTVGYDEKQGKYVGTWVDSMTNHMWHYVGSRDESGQKLVLEAEGPNMMTGEGTLPFRDSWEFKSADHILLTAEVFTDGKWVTFMTSDIRRKTAGK